ncbi:MAG TPA: hypothetical protein VJ842_18835 [Pyrinomonadaceae bacterium]|nr:hypothetical protein [Pyrinomonadaceae bacterium]
MRNFPTLPTLFIIAFLLACFAATPPAFAQSNTAKAVTPAQGSPERKAVLDAVRTRLKLKSQFKVYHLKVNGNWAYFHGGEVVDAGDGELQETDLDVKALLQLKTVSGKTAWVVAEIWTLPTDDKLSYKTFVARARLRQKAANVPADIFPSDM